MGVRFCSLARGGCERGDMATASVIAHRTGLDLKLARTAAMVTQTELAQRMGVTRQAVSNVEARYHVPGPTVQRYLDALRER